MGLDLYFQKVNSETEECEEVLAEFRKVNFLVAFFENLYDEYDPGEYNCKNFEVTENDIEYLINCCKEVLEDHSKAPLILPTTSDFFFGSQEYDDYYFSDVQDVLNNLEDYVLPAFDELREGEFISFYIWW